MIDPLSPLSITIYLLTVNVWTFAAFWYDKNCAEMGARRVAESSLLGLALIGGTPGAYLGRRQFRHKTRKQPFSDMLFAILVLQLAGTAGSIIYFA